MKLTKTRHNDKMRVVLFIAVGIAAASERQHHAADHHHHQAARHRTAAANTQHARRLLASKRQNVTASLETQHVAALAAKSVLPPRPAPTMDTKSRLRAVKEHCVMCEELAESVILHYKAASETHDAAQRAAETLAASAVIVSTAVDKYHEAYDWYKRNKSALSDSLAAGKQLVDETRPEVIVDELRNHTASHQSLLAAFVAAGEKAHEAYRAKQVAIETKEGAQVDYATTLKRAADADELAIDGEERAHKACAIMRSTGVNASSMPKLKQEPSPAQGAELFFGAAQHGPPSRPQQAAHNHKACANLLTQQCDGEVFSGERCCPSGAACVQQDWWWSDCRPQDATTVAE